MYPSHGVDLFLLIPAYAVNRRLVACPLNDVPLTYDANLVVLRSIQPKFLPCSAPEKSFTYVWAYSSLEHVVQNIKRQRQISCVVLHVSVERQRLKHLQSLMVVGMEDASCHVGFPASVGGKWQSVVSTW